MTVKNNSAAVHACTDVTGFGLAVHASEMAGDTRTIIINSSALPLLPDAIPAAENLFITSAGKRNRNYMQGKIKLAGIPAAMQEVIFDPQTSGGLLIAVSPQAAEDLCKLINAGGDHAAAIIGHVIDRKDKLVEIIPS
jgi:selenide,water dikinase